MFHRAKKKARRQKLSIIKIMRSKDNSGGSNDDKNSINVENAEIPPTGNPLTDYIPIMGLFIAGTHYTVTIPKKAKKRPCED
jgi:hypothetical protein